MELKETLKTWLGRKEKTQDEGRSYRLRRMSLQNWRLMIKQREEVVSWNNVLKAQRSMGLRARTCKGSE